MEQPSRIPSVEDGGSGNNQGGTPGWLKPLIGALVVLSLFAVYWLLSKTGVLDTLADQGMLEARIQTLGYWGPLAVIALMTAAIVFSPLPSAPIALAAGAAYGHVWGTIYVLVGAELGALLAFGIARFLGYRTLRRWFGERLDLGLLGTQNALMGIVFLSRLLPFISFDLVSYAAGLTPLTAWRFAVSTLAGIVPASFLLAHFGGEMASGESRRIAITVVALGGITLLPIVVRLVLVARRRRPREK